MIQWWLLLLLMSATEAIPWGKTSTVRGAIYREKLNVLEPKSETTAHNPHFVGDKCFIVAQLKINSVLFT